MDRLCVECRATPAWVCGQEGYYCDEQISYHIAWLKCTLEYQIGTINYIGVAVALLSFSRLALVQNRAVPSRSLCIHGASGGQGTGTSGPGAP
jgi:hypothetical protein